MFNILRYLILFCGIIWGQSCWADNAQTGHIYVDLATIPALLQMVDAVKQPADDPKLFIWKRFHTLPADDATLKELNATMSDAKTLGEFNYDLFNDFVDHEVRAFYQKYPDYKFVVHLNLKHGNTRSGHIFDIIPKQQIDSVHLYEDSMGHSYWSDNTEYNFKSVKTFARKYLHLGFYVRETMDLEENQLIFVDIHEIAKRLSVKQKQQIAHLVGLDLSLLSKVFGKTPTVVFVDDPSLSVAEASAFLEKLLQNEDVKRYRWLYKNHPRTSGKGKVFNLVKKYFPNIFVLPNAVPLESLILCGYTPSYIAGYGSSVFFSFKPEQILGYIKRNYLETYLQPLLTFGVLTDEKVFSKR